MEQQALVEARGFAAAEHLRQNLQLVASGVAHARDVPGTVDAGLRDFVGDGFTRGLGALGNHGRHFGDRSRGRDVAEIAGGFFLGGGQIDIAGQYQHGIVRAVPALEPGFDVIQGGGIEIVHRTDDRVVIRVAFRIAGLQQMIEHAAVRLVFTLAFFVLYHATLLIQPGLVDGAEQMAHAVGFHEQGHVQGRSRHVLEIVGAVGVGGAVLIGGADQFEGFEEFALVVFRALEHQVFEQVRETAAAERLVLGSDVVPDVDGDDRRLTVGMHDHTQAIRQGEFLIGDVHGRGAGGVSRRHEIRRGAEKGETERGRQQCFVSESHGRLSFGVNR